MVTEGSEHRRLSRRDFLALAGGIISAMSLRAMCGAEFSQAAAIEFPEVKCGGKNRMDKRILVTYASKYGSTGGVAEAIGKGLCSKGAAADVLLTKNVVNLSSYQGVVVGSAIYMGKWLPDAVEFVKTNCEMLRRVPVA
jgi:menaquinone-dependent protoporphyrinogen oxidase